MINNDSLEKCIPPLRLILNQQCNGNCGFCHREGYGADYEMDSSLINECAETAENLKIPHLSLTGGEPTLRTDLSDIIRDIQARYHGNITLTTNGYNLAELGRESFAPLHKLNLSIISINKNLYLKYQNVKPKFALESLQNFPAKNKNLNVVIIKENYSEINNIFTYCIQHSLSLDIMFELKKYSESDLAIQKYVFRKFAMLGPVTVKAGVTPALVVRISENCNIRIKHPKLSMLIPQKICQECKLSSDCYERICSVRVYPDGVVSPCINRAVCLSEGSLSDRIKKTYALFEPLNLSEIKFINPLF